MVKLVLMAVLSADSSSMVRSAFIAAAALAALSVSGCSLSNIGADDCQSNIECEDAFGLGSACSDGFCTEPPTCENGHGCRSKFGGGACVEGICRDRAPADPQGSCTKTEPPGLLDRSLTRDDPPFTVVGSMFRLDDSSDLRVSLGAQLAIQEIQDDSGLLEGRGIGMVFCDNGADLTGQERTDRINGAIDYLAGTLGAPFIVGPGTSSDALDALGYVIGQRYPTTFISPSATSPALSAEPDRLDAEDPHGLFWRTAPSDELQGLLLATDVVGQYPGMTPPPVSRVALVILDDSYGQGLSGVFQQQWVDQMGNAAQVFPFDNNDDNDWAQIADAVAAYAPDGILMIAITASRTLDFIGEMATRPAISGLPLFLTDGSKDADILLDESLDAAVKNIIFNQVVGTAPAGPDPASSAFNVFSANYESAFDENPSGFAFVANAYDAAYVGAAGVVYAEAQNGSAYDGRQVAEGMSRLVGGTNVVEVSRAQWSAIKGGLTSGDMRLDIVGISGPLDFDTDVGEATAPIEVWQPRDSGCSGASVCFLEVARIDPM